MSHLIQRSSSLYYLAIDQGTTSSRAIIFNEEFQSIATAQKEVKQYFPHSGWVEHDPEDIWQGVVACCKKAVSDAGLKFSDITAIGITNQRETTVVWDKKTGLSIHPAIVWQDRRTSDYCSELSQQYDEHDIHKKTGLLFDPYFSASKVRWILNHCDHSGDIAFGTIDSFLLWRLTGGRVHATDASNASRTLMYNIESQCWDSDLIEVFQVEKSMLPVVNNNADDYGVTDPKIFGVSIPITAMVGDQQGALFGQACLDPGMVKCTYGTGCFMVLNTGEHQVRSQNKMLATVGYRLNDKVSYAIEGSIFSAGVTIKWLRDKMKFIDHASDSEAMAASVTDNGGVCFVPAFTGLGAPHWNPDARAAIVGMSRGTEREHIVRAALESVAYQTKDLLHAMLADGANSINELRVDGGMVANNWLMQFLADILDMPVVCTKVLETTALGAAYLAAIGAGELAIEDVKKYWQEDRRFEPAMAASKRVDLYATWVLEVAKLR